MLGDARNSSEQLGDALSSSEQLRDAPARRCSEMLENSSGTAREQLGAARSTSEQLGRSSPRGPIPHKAHRYMHHSPFESILS